ncbi:dual specificity phosphatase [Sclerotinia borealis F-4128]|uniref:Dual specificity phosphatase n=1 Tax=Sclerotinia borealis (strain F-4128) TaxID=1432307 RepID=W9CFM1_SCLBF|nr:dual specificity phosphatase [Sclerotinia borealis F-4128]
MATIALPRPIPPGHTRSSSSSHPHPLTSTISLDHINTSAAFPIPIPNKHLPVCPTGPAPSEKPDTPPHSPPTKELSLSQRSLLYPPVNYNSYYVDSSIIYEIDAAGVAAALKHLAGQPLPDPSQVFPWYHGLHPCNLMQQTFFIQRRRHLLRTPKCIRGITIVKAGGDLTCSRLKGAITPDEFLEFGTTTEFQDINPKEGFSVRNFQIQVAKSAMVSDIIVYGDDFPLVKKLAREIAAAQQIVRETHVNQRHELSQYNTFICTSPFVEFEKKHPQIVSVDSQARWTGEVMDFFHQERVEMCAMTKASEIHHNVWLGPTPDGLLDDPASLQGQFDILIECNDSGQIQPWDLQDIAEGRTDKWQLGFPSSGMIQPSSWEYEETDGILETCKWIYNLAHGILPRDQDGDTPRIIKTMERKVLIHCTDGYTESTLLGLTYFAYATGLSVPKAWLDLHMSKKRNFFAYPSDVTFLTTIAPRLLSESPVNQGKNLADSTKLAREQPKWIKAMDGSLPSRVTDYMYLGNLGHVNNPDLLRHLGIKQVLSVGETATWKDGEMDKWGKDNVMVIQRVQDNGVDPLTEEFGRCLDFIERGKLNSTATLVHCRVGVSRSATICIAEIMRTMHLSFPRAYCFVRARRLNVIIQPHLRFTYELLKWEEKLKMREGRFGGKGWGRELEWADIAREIAEMNRPYSAR